MSRDGEGLLIVNADDWGREEPGNEAIAECYQVGGLTSATAMVFMRGSAHAADLAKGHPGLGVGLHLNLVEEYEDPDVAIRVRDRQRRWIERVRRVPSSRWGGDARARDQVSEIVADQLQGFLDLYQRLPTHLDGHRHCHLASDVLLSPALPHGTKFRNVLSDLQPSVSDVRALRELREITDERSFRTTDYLFPLKSVWPAQANGPLMDKLRLARSSSVEVMVHPAFPNEHRLVGSELWVSALQGLPVGSFDDL